MNSDCFSRDQLQSYLLGQLPDADSDLVALHVEACAACDATVTALDRESDTLIESLRQPVANEDPGTAYRLAARRAVAQWRDQQTGTSEDSHGGQHQRLRDYELLEPLAQGGMGTVYRARHVRLNRQVALKVLPGRWLREPAVVSRFEREMQAVGSLKHPAIVQATDGGDADGVYYLAMELVEGCDGSELVQSLGPLPISDACEIARQAALGMAYAHEQGIIHRDLKPSNLMVTNEGETKVLDLGLARVIGEQLAEDDLTTVGQLMGTLDFMAPEQMEDSHSVDERADIYSLGATLYKLLTGSPPHAGDPRTPLVVKLRHISSEPAIPIRERRPELPNSLSELIDGMLAQDADQRPSTMAEVVDQLLPFCADSNLSKRVSEAVTVRDRAPLRSDASLFASASSKPTATKEQSTAGGQRRCLSLAATLALLLVSGVLGIVITLEMTSGRLVIETASPDVEVSILKAGETYRSLTLKADTKAFRLGAGDYEVVITGDSDGLVVQNGTYTLKRGDTWVARIVEQTGSAPPGAPVNAVGNQPAVQQQRPMTIGNQQQIANTAEAPTYEGQTLDAWLAVLRRERSAKQLYEACRALSKLATGADTARAVDALLTAAQFHDRNTRVATGGQSTALVWSSVRMLLGSRDQTVVVESLNRELARNNPRTRDFILYYLSRGVNKQQYANDELLGHIERLTHDDSLRVRQEALGVLQRIGSENTILRRFLAALSDTEPAIQLMAAQELITRKANTSNVVATLQNLLRGGRLEDRAQAAWHLGDLGEQARAASAELVVIVNDEDLLVSRAAAVNPGFLGGPSSLGDLSVKDAAIRALAEIGDESAVPALVEEWNRRAYGRGSGRRSPNWQTNAVSRQSNTYTETWVADAIEQLSGMRPSQGRVDRNIMTVWKVNDRTAAEYFRFAYERSREPLPDSVEAMRKLVPRLSNPERGQLLRWITSEDLFPRSERAAIQVGLIDSLATAGDVEPLLMAVLRAWSWFARPSADEWPSVDDRTSTLLIYRQAAERMVRSLPDWEENGVDALLKMVESNVADRTSGVGVLMLSLLPDLNMERQTEVACAALRNFGASGSHHYGDSLKTLVNWASDTSHREAISERLQQARDDEFEALVVGLVRCDLADEATLQLLQQRFGDDLINRVAVVEALIECLGDSRTAGKTVAALIAHPALDEPFSVMETSRSRIEVSLRAQRFIPLLSEVPPAHRLEFEPMLRELVRDGKNSESESARRVLANWK